MVNIYIFLLKHRSVVH